MTTKHHLSPAQALAVIEDDSTEWTVVPDGGEAAAIRHWVELRREAAAKLDEVVIRGRRRGLTWVEIGDALGVSHQAARKKYADRT